MIVRDVDATVVLTRNERELAAPRYKRRLSYHSIGGITRPDLGRPAYVGGKKIPQAETRSGRS